MGVRVAFLLSAILSGCAETDEIVVPRPNDVCSTVAVQRMKDGALNGYDRKLQKLVYDYTYADCVKWNAARGRPYR